MTNNRYPAGTKEWYLINTYLQIKEYVLSLSHNEVTYLDGITFEEIDESFFLREAAWVILNSGMRESVIRQLFANISATFFHWKSAREIIINKKACFSKAILIFGHKGKILSIISVAQLVADLGLHEIKDTIVKQGVVALKLPYLGPVTSKHLEKNIGLDVIKPDRHLKRISQRCGYSSADCMCSEISDIVGDKKSFIDTILWRFATLRSDYLSFF